MISKKAFVLVLALTGVSTPALANMFVFKDPDYKFTFAYPDTWKLQTPDGASRVRVAGPGGDDMAACKIKAAADGRLKIYPKRLMETAVNETLTAEFWDNEVNQFNDAKITDMHGSAGLGQGDATSVRVNYTETAADGSTVWMTAVMLSTIYGENRFTMSCSAKAERFYDWAGVFGNIMNSVQLEERYTMFPAGYYRDFLSEHKRYYIPPKNLAITNRD